MNTKALNLLHRATQVLSLIDQGKLDPRGVDMQAIHDFSIELGEGFKESYNNPAYTYEETDNLLEAYREVRRTMPLGSNGKRWRSYDAYLSTNA